MWNSYYYKILDSWTPPLYWAPRWFSANAYATLSDDIDTPSTVTPASGIFYTPSASSIPDQWVLTSVSPSLSGNVLQKLFEVYTNEKEYLFPALTSTLLSYQFVFNTSEPEYAWILENLKPVEILEVETVSGRVEVSRAESDLELFYSGNWKWKQDQGQVLIYGLDIQKITDYKDSNNWHFLDSTETWTTGSVVYMEHPVTKNWIPLHSSKIRSDGFTNFNYNGSIRFRCSSVKAAKLLEVVTVYVNGEKKQARRIGLSNTIDEKALFVHLNRRYKESNEDLASTILKASWFRGQSITKVRSYLSAALRTGQLLTVPASASSFSIPASATGFAVRNINQYAYLYENIYAQSPNSSSQFLTIYASGDLPCAYLRGIKTDITVSGSVLSFDTYIDNTVDRPLLHWRIPYWTSTASAVYLTDNFPHNVPDLIVFLSSKVDVVQASVQTLKKSFNRTSPSFRWSRSKIEEENAIGLADFDF